MWLVIFFPTRNQSTSDQIKQQTDELSCFLLVCSGAVAEATSDTLRVCAIQRSLARGHDKSCDPRHGAKISLILKGDNVPRIRD